MSSDEVSKVRDTFQQIEREKREQQGMGMGLVVVQRLIELHNGTFEIGSVSGKGTQVTFSLPIYTADDMP
jgi:signal transduction histidine kinase